MASPLFEQYFIQSALSELATNIHSDNAFNLTCWGPHKLHVATTWGIATFMYTTYILLMVQQVFTCIKKAEQQSTLCCFHIGMIHILAQAFTPSYSKPKASANRQNLYLSCRNPYVRFLSSASQLYLPFSLLPMSLGLCPANYNLAFHCFSDSALLAQFLLSSLCPLLKHCQLWRFFLWVSVRACMHPNNDHWLWHIHSHVYCMDMVREKLARSPTIQSN